MSKKLSIVIHTEGEFDWEDDFKIGQPSVTHLDALKVLTQQLLEVDGKITFALDHDFISMPFASSFVKEYANPANVEFASHLHPWITPPYDDNQMDSEVIPEHNTYPCNIDTELERQKLECLTNKISSLTNVRPVTYLAGRYGVGINTVQNLKELGYSVDISISPYADFSFQQGPNFSQFDNQCIKSNNIVFVPHTTGYISYFNWFEDRLNKDLSFKNLLENKWWGKVLMNLLGVQRIRLSPEGYKLKEMKMLINSLSRVGFDNFILSFHSPSLVPNKTPYVNNQAEACEIREKIVDFVSWAVEEGFQPVLAKEFANLQGVVERKDLFK